MTNDEIKIIRWWRANVQFGDYCTEVPEIFDTRYLACDGTLYTLTPRGQDLIASAALFDLEKKPQEEEKPRCQGCGDTGQIPILGNFTNPCPSCNPSIVSWIQDPQAMRWALEIARQERIEVSVQVEWFPGMMQETPLRDTIKGHFRKTDVGVFSWVRLGGNERGFRIARYQKDYVCSKEHRLITGVRLHHTERRDLEHRLVDLQALLSIYSDDAARCRAFFEDSH